MKFNELLIETPLPDDWDKSIYSDNISFNKRLKYAKEKATIIGTGSSRVAFEIPYQGRRTVLKIAKNTKGIAQNEEEIQMFNDWYLKSLNITIPMIDADEEGFTWIHTEFAGKAKQQDFKKETGYTLPQTFRIAKELTGKYNLSNTITDGKEDELLEIDLISSLVDLFGNYDIPIDDYERVANWGIYKGSPVIIDLGLSKEVYDKFYKRKW